jgi:hypothetical protein
VTSTQETTVFENEVVTHAHVRYLRVPGLAGELALITLDNGHDHTRPSTFGPGGLASLDAALDDIAAHSPAPVAIAVTGKPFIFAVGADLSGRTRPSRRSRSSTARHWAGGSSSRCTATTGRWPAGRSSPSPRCSSVSSPAGAAHSCCRT